MNINRTLPTRRPAFAAAFCILLFLCAPILALAQSSGTGSITGRVLNPLTGEYLRNATVSVEGTQISTTTGTGGYYTLTGVPAGEARVSVSYTGLDTKVATVNVPAGQSVSQDFSLTRGGEDTIMLDALTISAEREGNARAIMQQRVAPNIKKVIAADAMGNVSEGNVGEFLKLMPGVAMDYVEADTRAMRVRGLNPKYSMVLFDLHQIANAGSSNVGTGRAFEFEQLSISSVETVELTKSPTPDTPSTVAGTVNLKPKSAFDRKGRYISFSAAASWNSYYTDLEKTPGWDNFNHRKVLPNASIEFSDVFLDGKLGVVAGVDLSSTIAAQKHVWFFGNTFNTNLADNDTELPVINRIWYQDGPKPTDRGNYSLGLEYRASDNLQVYARADLATYDARFYNRTLNLRATTYAPGATATDMTVTTGRISVDSNQFMTKEGETLMLSSGGTYKKDNLTVDLGLHHSIAKNWYGNREKGHFTDFSSSVNNVSWRMTRPDPGSSDLTFTQLSGPDWRNPSNYTFDANSIGWHERAAKDQIWSARLDVTHDLSSAPLSQTIKYGARTSLKVLDIRRAGLLTVNPAGNDGIIGNSDDPRPADFVDPRFRTDWDTGGNMNNFFALSPWLIHERYLQFPNQFPENTAANNLARLRGNWDFKETIHAAYISDTFKFGKLSVAPGLRYETTDSQGKGINNSTNLPISGGNDYDAWLKYLHLTYDVTKNFVIRGSYHDAITRADIANLIPGISNVDFTNAVLSASNPDLKEERSKSYNLSLEYYFEPVGVISVSGFHTELKDRQFVNQVRLGSSGYEGDTTYANWTLNGPVNFPEETTYTGFEVDYQQQLSFLPGVFRGLGVFANHTRVRYDDWAFNLGSPKVMTNGGVSFKYKRFFGRVNVNWVGKLLQNPARTYNVNTRQWSSAAPFIEIYQRDRMIVDINLEYHLTNNLTIFLDGRNTLNEPSVYTYYGKEENFERILKTGGIWMMGIKGKF
jgi:iron complex outermembrane recepter protein